MQEQMSGVHDHKAHLPSCVDSGSVRLQSGLLLTVLEAPGQARKKGNPAESFSQLFLEQWFPNFSVCELGRPQLTARCRSQS